MSSPWVFLLCTILWTWAFWIPAAMKIAEVDGDLSLVSPLVLLSILIGGAGPTLMAIVFSAINGGISGVKAILAGFLIWDVGVRWYAFAFLAPVAFLSVGMLLFAASGGSLGAIDLTQTGALLMAFLVAIPFGPLGEELGWRGFALPALLRKHHALTAACIIGGAWTLWHVPLFFAPIGTWISGLSISAFYVSMFAARIFGLSIIYTWMMARTGGSVLMALLLHTAGNAGMLFVLFPGLLPEAETRIMVLSIVPIWVLAVFVVAKYGAKTLGGPVSD